MKKERADKLLVEQNLVKSRETGKREIMAGNVFVNTNKILKAGQLLPIDSILTVKQKEHNYVSRGGLKLEKSLKLFRIDVKDTVCIDIGSSTGGFTDCLLQNKAKFVYCVDVGTNQLDYSLRRREDVKVYEKTNIKVIEPSMFEPLPTIAVCDVSFISLYHVFESLKRFDSITDFIALIKPQFEAGKEAVDKGKGVVNDKEIHYQVIDKIIDIAQEANYTAVAISHSPIRGKKEGNIEYITHFKFNANPKAIDIISAIDEAFEDFK